MADRALTGLGNDRRRDAGFTLVELLITIVITGILVAVLAGAVSVVVNQESSTNDRVTDAAGAQLLALYFPRDVSSAPVDARLSDPLLPSGCSGANEDGFNVLQMTWTESAGGAATTYRAAYRLRNSGGVGQLARISCSGAGSLGAADEVVVARSLATVPPGWTAGSAPAVVSPLPNPATAQVSLTLTAASTAAYTAQGSTNNPAATLPATTAATLPPPPETTTTAPPASTTTNPPGPCVVTAISAVDLDGVAPDDSSVLRYDSGPLNKSLVHAVVITATTTGNCVNLRMQYFPKKPTLSHQAHHSAGHRHLAGHHRGRTE